LILFICSAAESKCANWKHPDKYGNYRVAKLTQIKHHWWWKVSNEAFSYDKYINFEMNFIFEGIPAMKANNGWVLLLEEDHYVSPDFLHVLRMIVDKKERLDSDDFNRNNNYYVTVCVVIVE